MVFSLLKSSVVSEFTRNPERRKDLPRVIDEAMGSVSSKDIENHSRHQAEVVTQYPRRISLSPDDLTYREIDYGGGEGRDELHTHDAGALLEEVEKRRSTNLVYPLVFKFDPTDQYLMTPPPLLDGAEFTPPNLMGKGDSRVSPPTLHLRPRTEGSCCAEGCKDPWGYCPSNKQNE